MASALQILPAADVAWDGEAGANTSFHQALNWDNDQVPGTGDRVTLSAPLSHAPVVLTSGAISIESMDATAPLMLNETLIVAQPSRFLDSLVPSGSGRLRANALVTLQGSNNVEGVTLEGSVGFLNEGDLLFNTKPLTTTLENQGRVWLGATAQIRLARFVNKGTLRPANSGGVNASSIIENEGILTMDGLGQSSKISAAYFQTNGTLNIDVGNQLTLAGATQVFAGGSVVVDGTLQLVSEVGGTQRHAFAGLGAITGQGSVRQTQAFTLEDSLVLSLAGGAGYQAGSLEFAADVTLQNAGIMGFDGTEAFTVAGGTTGQRFVNQSVVTHTAPIANPSFAVPTRNTPAGTWTAGSFRCGQFLNEGSLVVEGAGRVIDAAGPTPLLANAAGATFRVGKGGDPGGSTVCRIPFDQATGGLTEISQASFSLEGGAPSLGGIISVDSTSEFRIRAGTYSVPASLHLIGQGRHRFGVDSSDPVLRLLSTGLFDGMVAECGITDNDTEMVDRGFYVEGGSMELGQSRLLNLGVMHWEAGKILSAVPGTFNQTLGFHNARLLFIRSGVGTRVQGGHFVNRYDSRVIQEAPFTMGDGGTPGSVVNRGTWRLRNGAAIHSTNANDRFVNEGTVIVESGIVPVLADFLNNHEVHVQAGAQLHLEKCANLVVAGQGVNPILRGGRWIVSELASISFAQGPIDTFGDLYWEGPAPSTLTNITEVATTLRVTADQVLSNPLRVDQGASLDLAADGTLTVPEVDIRDGARVGGRGTIVAPGGVNVEGGIVSPGDSPGTLTVVGDVVLTNGTVFVWEASGPNPGQHDLLQVSNGTIRLGGILRPVLLDGFVPETNSVFTVIAADAVEGDFDARSGGGFGNRTVFSVNVSSNAVTLETSRFLPDDYAAWAAETFAPGELADPLVSGPFADPENDRLRNIQEYAHGLRAGMADPAPMRLHSVSSNAVDLVFPWAEGMSDVTFAVQAALSADGTYQTIDHEIVSSVSDGFMRTLTVRVVPPEGAGNWFLGLLLQIVEP